MLRKSVIVCKILLTNSESDIIFATFLEFIIHMMNYQKRVSKLLRLCYIASLYRVIWLICYVTASSVFYRCVKLLCVIKCWTRLLLYRHTLCLYNVKCYSNWQVDYQTQINFQLGPNVMCDLTWKCLISHAS